MECIRVLLEGDAQANQQDKVSGCALEHAGHVEMHDVHLYGFRNRCRSMW